MLYNRDETLAIYSLIRSFIVQCSFVSGFSVVLLIACFASPCIAAHSSLSPKTYFATFEFPVCYISSTEPIPFLRSKRRLRLESTGRYLVFRMINRRWVGSAFSTR